MRLTNEIRDKIIKEMATNAVEKERLALVKREGLLAMKLWKAVYPKAERDLAAKLPAGWIRMDKCLMFNLNGMSIRLDAPEPVTVKSSDGGYCHRLGNISDQELGAEFLKLDGDRKDLERKFSEIKATAKALLYSVGTYNSLEKAWPEGKKFYEKFKPKNESSGVPATLTANLNALVGIK